VNLCETRTWAAGPGIKLVKLIIVTIVTERAKTVLILMGIPPECEGWKLRQNFLRRSDAWSDAQLCSQQIRVVNMKEFECRASDAPRFGEKTGAVAFASW
jgi:hypothetical protein